MSRTGPRGLKEALGDVTETSIRFYGSLFLVFLMLLFTLTNLASSHRQTLVDMRKAEIRRMVEIGIRTIQPILDQHGSGALGRDEAIARIRAIVGRMTYESETMDNYLFMSSYDGTMLVQPLQPELEGTYQLDAKDSNGVYYIRELIGAAKSPEREGFVSYRYPPPGATAPGHKLSYVRGLDGIGCYIGTGMFFDDIEALNRKYLIGPLLSVSVAFALISLLFLVVLRPLARCIQILVKAFRDISADPAARRPVPATQFAIASDERKILLGFADMLETLDEHQERLIESEKLSTIGVLVAGVAHEINNPNQFIMSNSGLVGRAWDEIRPILKEYGEDNGGFSLLGRPYDEAERLVPGYVEGIEEGSRRINAIVADLKSYVRAEPENPAPVRLNLIAESALKLCAGMIAAATDSLVFEKDQGDGVVFGNAQRLEQVVINLLENACAATEDRSSPVSLVVSSDRAAGFGSIEVRDRGRGMAEDELAKIVLPFYTTKRERGGTGLGLSVSQKIVERHRGRLEFASEPGAGTAARVILPLARTTADGKAREGGRHARDRRG